MTELADALREAYPDLDRLAQLGAVAEMLGALSVGREDVAIALVGGRIYIGRPDERAIDGERMVGTGTYGVEPTTDDWERVIEYVSKTPRADHTGRNIR